MPCVFNLFVYDVDGRIVAVQPDTQIVELMVDCVTSGLVAPGVHDGSGSGRYAWEQSGSELACAVPGTPNAAAANAMVAAVMGMGRPRERIAVLGRPPG